MLFLSSSPANWTQQILDVEIVDCHSVSSSYMWTDNETEKDFLNFSSVAKTVAQVIYESRSKPISIGLSGAWGVGKSTMIKLVKHELHEQQNDNSFIFVEFNAWLYQSYDDARAALIEVVATTLMEEAEKRESYIDKAKGLLERVNWFRAMKMTTTSAASIALGLPPTGLIGEIYTTAKSLLTEEITQESLSNAEKTASNVIEQGKEIISPKELKTPPKEIEALRKSFEELLQEMNVTLVVLIDDLDRCLPDTTISTLEAIRLLLFLKNTAFVIAADDQMIKHAVKKHFKGVEDELVTSYFDKLIQVPIRVPPLGTQEVRAYMMLLFIENSDLSDDEKEELRYKCCDQLSKTWQGKRVDLKFVRSVNENLSDSLVAKLDTADRLAPFMVSTSEIAGNPRLIKRFLNALSIRMAMAKAQGVSVDEAVLAKILLFERCGNTKAYSELVKAVTESNEGKPEILDPLEADASIGKDSQFPDPWNDSFIKDWLRIPPTLSNQDLRGALYVSREHAPLILPEDRLSPEASELLEGLLEHPDMALSIKQDLVSLARPEISVIMDRLLGAARNEQEWGTPGILTACIIMSQVDQTQGSRLAGFLKDRPGAQITPSIVPKIDDEKWAKSVFDYWLEDSEIKPQVKRAIKARSQK